MRESNFSNPTQNRACLSISAVVYDRRGTYAQDMDCVVVSIDVATCRPRVGQLIFSSLPPPFLLPYFPSAPFQDDLIQYRVKHGIRLRSL